MSDLLTTSDLQTEREVAREPARGWRNKFIALAPGYFNNRFVETGEVFWGSRLWPSKDTARTAYAEDRQKWPDVREQYLGPYPEEAAS